MKSHTSHLQYHMDPTIYPPPPRLVLQPAGRLELNKVEPFKNRPVFLWGFHPLGGDFQRKPMRVNFKAEPLNQSNDAVITPIT